MEVGERWERFLGMYKLLRNVKSYLALINYGHDLISCSYNCNLYSLVHIDVVYSMNTCILE